MVFRVFQFVFVACFGWASAEFCTSHLFGDAVLCDDGSTMPAEGCCPDNNGCPSTCSSASMRSGPSGLTCTCTGCARVRRISLTAEEQWTKAHNYFRCRHGQPSLAWDSTVATNSETASAQSCAANTLQHSSSYSMNPSAGENLAMGHNSPEAATEAWYNEITDPGYVPGTRGSSGVGHYTAMIWQITTKLGCSTCTASRGSPVWACQYADSPPNYGGLAEYIANVPQSNTPTASESHCCDTVYGSSNGGSGLLSSASTHSMSISATLLLAAISSHL